MSRRLFHVVIAVWLLALALVALPSSPALAVGTNPTLTLDSVDAFASTGGAVSVTVFGTYSFDDLMQFSFPAGLIVFQGSQFVRYDFAGAVTQGTLASLQDGVSAAEIPTILASGALAPAPALLMHLSADRVQVVLPAGFPTGAVSVVVYAILESTPFVSNTLTVTVP